MKKETSLGIIGQGAWGSALKEVYARAGRDVAFVTNASHARDIMLLAVPAQAVRDVCAGFADTSATIVICAKGIELRTGKLMHEVVQEVLPRAQSAILSGPNFAHEIKEGKPAASAIAAVNMDEARTLQKLLTTPQLRLYAQDDRVGVALAGALKNVYAIACGMITGAGLGENARAALITRALVEMRRLVCAMGGKEATVYGLAGIGDMVLTCGSATSRNMAFGVAFAQNEDASDALTEGVPTAQAALLLAEKYHVAMPIAEATAHIVSRKITLKNALSTLIERPLKDEA